MIEAVTKEWKNGPHQLPIQEFAYLFQMKWTTLKNSSTVDLKSWFAKVCLSKENRKTPNYS